MSRRLDDDERLAYARFWHEAQRLGTISRSFDLLARSAAAAYLEALEQPARRTWTTLVNATALLVQKAQAIDGIIVFDPAERAALQFFADIVSENADLLERPAAINTPAPTPMLLSL